MDYTMVSLVLQNGEVYEVSLPNFVRLSDLLGMLEEALGILLESGTKIQAEPLARILDNHKTLTEEGVGQGAYLTLI